jgi:cell division protein FtsB
MPSARESGWKIFFSSKIFILIVAIVAVMVVFSYARVYYQDYLVRQEIAYLEERVKKMEAKKMELLDVLTYVKSNEFVEEKARTELNMIKPGEQVLVVPQAAAYMDGQEEYPVVKLENTSNYQKWFRYFFN